MTDIEDVLFEQIAALAELASVQVKWPNTNGPEGVPTWIDVVHIPNGVAKSGWNDLKINQGIINLGLNVPPNSGSYDAAGILDFFKQAFAQGTVFIVEPTPELTPMRVEIYSPPTLGAVFENGQKAVYPLQILYRSFEDS